MEDYIKGNKLSLLILISLLDRSIARSSKEDYFFKKNLEIYTNLWPKAAKVTIPAIQGIPVPVAGATPKKTVSETNQYTGTVTWVNNNDVPLGNGATFVAGTKYKAIITLTHKAGYTLHGVAANFFTVAGASTSNPVNTGIITAVFPAASF